MTVRTTESRLPVGFAASSLGQSAVAPANAKVMLVAYLSSPVALRRTLRFVVFVTDAGLAARVASYTWTFTDGAGASSLDTDIGIAAFSPQNAGGLTISVQLKDAASATLAMARLDQQVVALNNELELLIDEPRSNVPLAAHPDTARELVNDLRSYVDALIPAEQDGYVRLLCSLAFNSCLQAEEFRRHRFMEDLAAVLNRGKHLDFFSVAKNGFGVCRLRPQLAAMVLKRPGGGDYIAFTELPEAVKKQAKVLKAIRKDFDTLLSEDDKVDFFNLLRFPKSHFDVTRRVCDKLQGQYHSGESFAATLGNTTKALKLLTQILGGPIAIGKKFKPGGPAKSTRALMANPLWKIKAVAGAAAAPGGGGGAALAPGPVGAPEVAPSLTFIGTGGKPGYLANATAYHTTSGLSPWVATSFESMLHDLAASAAPIERLRIVSHFALDTKHERGQILIPFFANQRDASNRPLDFMNSWYFEYGESDDTGLLAFYANEEFPDLTPGSEAANFPQPLSAAATSPSPLHLVLLRVLQARNHPALAPFGLRKGNAANAALTLLKWCADLFALQNSRREVRGEYPTVPKRDLPAAIVDAEKTYIRARIDGLKTKAGVMVEANVNALRDAITALGSNDLPVPIGSLGSFTRVIGGVFLQDHPALRADLAVVRDRLDNAFVDIRGCRVSQDKAFMQAARKFFGNPAKEPTVSAPDWFQNFSIPGYVAVAGESDVDTVWNSGTGEVPGADIQRAYADWAGMIGLNAHLSFWTTTFGGDPFAFLGLGWVGEVPPLGMPAIQLAGFGALDYPAVLDRLKKIFFIPASTGPTATEMATFATTHLPQVASLKQAMDAVDQLNPASPQSEMQAALQLIQAVATATGQALPAAPAPLALPYLQNSIGSLKQFLVTASKITPLLAALKAKSLDPRFGIRSMMGLGLPLLAQNSVLRTRFSVACLDALQADALRSLLGIHWAQPLPAAVDAAIAALAPAGAPTWNAAVTPTNDTARAMQLTVLNSARTDDKNTLATPNPENEFHAHIKTEP